MSKVKYTNLAKARLAKAEKKIKQQAYASIKDIKNVGKEYLKSIVPYDTGWLYRTIQGKVLTRSGGPQAVIKFEPYITPKSHRWKTKVDNYPNFSLVRWAATSPKARGHFKNGDDPRWMKRTRAKLLQYAPGKIRNDYKRLKL